MQILSVNVAMPRVIEINGKAVPTGIYKEPVTGPVELRKLGLAGDGQADLTVHGGEHQAVYAYPIEHYPHWAKFLGAESLAHGTFGENLTTSGLVETEVCIGDVHRMGNVLLQVTCERLPCFKFAHKVGRPDILKPFLQSGHSGFYYKVLQEGTLAMGDTIEIVEQHPLRVTVRDLLGVHRLNEEATETLEKLLTIEALAPIVRKDLEKRLAA
ncbi:MOSC domain-containing protein YiiM [Roseimicrobium gellanilyticum]|uniref:MOSC domain-containing protein YiiM n=1 Tax=Roseimicrobium gellanilyticum TaxID=748857 RepID=A0A366HFR3_9BACT|nr:MOSC domain-containing protein [Roseimicrobium gellanilyticum]RBP41367.1 MOSC domain-containing protein YiiM [Roseimicrobium gellanilyticum]